jgi:hypothetical protein
MKLFTFEVPIKIPRDCILAKFGTGSEELMLYCFCIRLFCFQPVLAASLVTSDPGNYANISCTVERDAALP